MRRAFGKAVRRKPLAFAANAGLWKLNVARKERIVSWATAKGSSMVILGMSTQVREK
jgi:hypothetical protein